VGGGQWRAFEGQGLHNDEKRLTMRRIHASFVVAHGTLGDGPRKMASVHAGCEDGKAEWPAAPLLRPMDCGPTPAANGLWPQLFVRRDMKDSPRPRGNRGAFPQPMADRGARGNGRHARDRPRSHKQLGNARPRGNGGVAAKGTLRTHKERVKIIRSLGKDSGDGSVAARGGAGGQRGCVFTYALSAGAVCPRARLTPPPFLR
jgi:hypothetical protein